MANYDRRSRTANTGMDFESVAMSWMKQAAPIMEREILAKAKILKNSGSKVHVQPNMCEFDINAEMPMEPGRPKANKIPVQIHVEWDITSGMTFDAYVTLTFEGGGKAHREFKFGWDKDVTDQGAQIGVWIATIEPVAPTES